MKEIYNVSKGSKKDRADISHIANKYFPPGAEIQHVVDALTKHNFKLVDVVTSEDKNVPSGEVWYFMKHDRNPYIVVRVTTLIVLHSDGVLLLSTDGRIYYTGL